MNLSEILIKRHSIRKFKEVEVPYEKIKDIIELAKLAPSAGNLQSYKIAILEGIPTGLIICADLARSASKYGERGITLYAIQDATIFASYIQLIAIDLGLSSCWVGAFNEEKTRKFLNLPENLWPIIAMYLGYADEIPRKTQRRKFSEIIYENKDKKNA